MLLSEDEFNPPCIRVYLLGRKEGMREEVGYRGSVGTNKAYVPKHYLRHN